MLVPLLLQVAVERLLKMKAQAAEPNKVGSGSRGAGVRLTCQLWDSLLLAGVFSGGSAEPGWVWSPNGSWRRGPEDPSLRDL